MLNEKKPELKFKDSRRHKKKLIDNLKSIEIKNYEQAKKCFETAERARCVSSTHLNNTSSRSHAIFLLKVMNRNNGQQSTLFLVDLAGSERIKKSHVAGERIGETIAINSSLTTLGKCIIALGERKISHIPFRESKLTSFLKDALGGNCKTALIISLSPDRDDIDETISSLLFGQRAKRVQCRPAVTVREDLRAENAQLRKQLNMKIELIKMMNLKHHHGGHQMEERNKTVVIGDDSSNESSNSRTTLNAGCRPRSVESFYSIESQNGKFSK